MRLFKRSLHDRLADLFLKHKYHSFEIRQRTRLDNGEKYTEIRGYRMNSAEFNMGFGGYDENGIYKEVKKFIKL